MRKIKAIAHEPISALSAFQGALGQFLRIDHDTTGDPRSGIASIDKEIANICDDTVVEVFWNLYPYETPPARNGLDDSRKFVREIMSKFAETQEFKQIKDHCRGDIINSAIMADVIANMLISSIKQKISKAAQQKAQGSGSGKENKDDQSGSGSPDPNQPTDEELSTRIADMLARESDKDRENAVINKAMESANGSMDLAAGWGINRKASVRKEDIDKVMRLVKRISTHLPTIVKLMGRLKGIAQDDIYKKTKEKGLVVRDGYTRELYNIFPSELALMRKDANPFVRADKISQYADHGLLGMVASEGGEKEGALILAIDDSGSMYSGTGAGGISCAENALAMGLGMAMAAKSNKQKFVMFKYSDVPFMPTINQDADFRELTTFIEKINGSGTDFIMAFEQIFKCIDGLSEEDKKNADVLFITDGSSGLDRKTLLKMQSYKKKYKTRLVGFGIGDHRDRAQYNIKNNPRGYIDINDAIKRTFLGYFVNNSNMELAVELFDAVIVTNDIERDIEDIVSKLQKALMH